MASIRKLQQEIQQNLKKVDEGIEIFDDTWEKVYAAEQQSLKEKYEADLKKEIKKLQRLRDQIKVWIGNNDIKDKTQLVEARKTIESKMEMFKVCEKDTKTKAYSKEGLARETKLDPREQLREEKRIWLNECLDTLNDLINSVDLEKEKLLGAKGRVKDKAQMERVENRLQKHKWHIARLEQIIKLMDNDDLDPSAVDSIQDSLDYYLESAADDDGAIGVEDEFDIYEELELDSLGAGSFEIPKTGNPKDETGDNAPSVPIDPEAGTIAPVVSVASPAPAPTPALATNAAAPASAPASANKKAPKTNAKESAKPAAASIVKSATAKSANLPPATSKVPGVSSVLKTGKSVKDSTDEGAKSTTDSSDVPSFPSSAVGIVSSTVSASTPATAPMSWATAAGIQPSHSDIAPAVAVSTADPGVKSGAVKVAVAVSVTARSKSVTDVPEATPVDPASDLSLLTEVAHPPSSSIEAADTEPTTSESRSALPVSTVVPYLEEVSPSDGGMSSGSGIGITNAPETIPAIPSPQLQHNTHQPKLSTDAIMALNQLQHSMVFTPESLELDKQSRNYYAHSHPSFPTTAAFSAQSEATALFEKLPMDTLFFVFYFQQGTFQQYLAAKQLKKHSWRFHKKYMTWFQRHEEPNIATEEFEEGTYVYFDYESGWCQRIKSEFKFEYAYLEDELGGDL